MARFNPQSFNINDINGGERFENGQKPQQDAFNAPIEGSAYAIEQAAQANAKADKAETKADQALNFAFGSVSGFSPLTAYPIGSIYMSVNETSPAELFGGSWEKIKDKFLIGAGNLYALGENGGSADAVLVQHGDHLFTYDGESIMGNGSGNTPRFLSADKLYETGTKGRGWNVWIGNEAYPAGKSLGEDGTNKNLPPYLAVNIWKRTA